MPSFLHVSSNIVVGELWPEGKFSCLEERKMFVHMEQTKWANSLQWLYKSMCESDYIDCMETFGSGKVSPPAQVQLCVSYELDAISLSMFATSSRGKSIRDHCLASW